MTELNDKNFINNEQTTTSTPEVKKHKSGAGKVIALALCCSLVGSSLGVAGTAFAYNKLFDKSSTSSAKSTHTSTVLEGKRDKAALQVSYVDTSKEMTPAEVYAANVNSTVGITTEITTNYFGYQTTTPASGSGFILTEDGYIVTNYHVIESGSSIKVTLYDNSEYKAEVVGYDESNDLAILKIDASGLTPVVLGSSDNMNVGDSVIAIGNPLGELTFSLTSGIISAVDRDVTINNLSMNLIQTDCAINSGNSGGALFNMYGEVIGITNAKYSGNSISGSASIDNIGFAIPIDSIKSIINDIIEDGYISKPFIGVSVGDLDGNYKSFGLPEGAVIYGVVDGSPADEAGLQENDIVTAIDGEDITSSSDLKKIVLGSEVGDTLKLSVYRQGEEITLKVKVSEQKQDAITGQSEKGHSGQSSSGWGFKPGDRDNEDSDDDDNRSANPFSEDFPWEEIIP